jgi:hypothetical protein
MISSSDTETEDNISMSGEQRISTKSQQANTKTNRMLLPTSADEKKLNSIKQTVQQRPYQASGVTQTVSRPVRNRPSLSNIVTGGSSDDVDSLYDQSTSYAGLRSRSPSASMTPSYNHDLRRTPSIMESTDSLTTIQSKSHLAPMNKQINDRYSVDCASVTSSEWGTEDNKSERDGSTFQRQNPSVKCE